MKTPIKREQTLLELLLISLEADYTEYTRVKPSTASRACRCRTFIIKTYGKRISPLNSFALSKKTRSNTSFQIK